MELLIWLIIIFFWIISLLAKTKKGPQPKEEPYEPTYEPSEEEEEILETLGLPLPIPREKPKEKIEEAPILIQKEEVKPEIEVTPVEPLPKPEISPETKPPEFLSSDKLEEGIILSIILGPPKALTICRGVGTGIRSGLKNRWL